MGNSLQLSSCKTCHSADILCMTRLNYPLCSGFAGGAAPGRWARVVHTATGELMEAREGTMAAEVMLEHPNHFVICSASKELAPGKRFAPLASHQELLNNHLYFLVPMQKLRARLSQKDIALFSHLANKVKAHRPPVSGAAAAPLGANMRRDNFLLPPSAVLTHKSPLSHSPPLAEESLLSSFINRTPPPSSLWRPKLHTIDETPHLRSSWTLREGLSML